MPASQSKLHTTTGMTDCLGKAKKIHDGKGKITLTTAIKINVGKIIHSKKQGNKLSQILYIDNQRRL